MKTQAKRIMKGERHQQGTLRAILLLATCLAVGIAAATDTVLENEFLRMVLQPDPHIGFIRELVYKPTGRDLSAFSYFKARGGEGPATQRTNLGYLWLQGHDIRCELTKDTADEKVLDTSYRWTEKQDGMDYDFLFRQSYVLKRGESRLKVIWSIKNMASEKRSIGPWQKNTMLYRGACYTMLPQGPSQVGNANDFFPSVTHWLARVGGTTGAVEETFFAVYEHEKLHELYVYEGPVYTLEALYAPANLEPGQEWSTTYFLGVTTNLTNIAFAVPEGAIAMTPLTVEAPGKVEVTLDVAPVMALGKVRLEGNIVYGGRDIEPLAPRQVDWTPGHISRIAYSFNASASGAYILRLNVYRGAEQYRLGQEVSVYRPFIEIPLVVGKLPAGQNAIEPWPKKALAFPKIEGREIKLPVVADAGGFRVGLAHPTERIFREDRLAKDSPATNGISLCAAAGEWESIPLVVFPGGGQGLDKIQVSVAPLRRAGSDAAVDRIRLFRVGHFLTSTPSRYNPLPVGNYPGPLLPFDGPAAIAKGLNGGFWINIQAPLDAVAGEYQGTVNIDCAQGKAAIPLRLRVWNFQLPSPPSLKTSAGSVFFNIAKQMKLLNVPKYDPAKIRDDYVRWCLDYGFSPGHGMPGNYDVARMQEWGRYNRGLSALCSGYENVAKWATAETIHKCGWEGRVYHYMPFDEHGDTVVPQVADWCRQFREKNPGIKALDVYYGANTKPLHGLVDVWCVALRRNEWTRERMAAGDEFWMVNGHLIWSVDEVDFFKGRCEYWKMWSYKYTGQLPWSIVNWAGKPPDFNTLGNNASAMLLYPLPGGLTTTINWENMRDGLEDYDYLAVLKQRATAAAGKADPGLLETARRIYDDPDLHERVTDREQLEKLRQEIGALIEKLSSGVK